MIRRIGAICLAGLLLAGCTGVQSALDPAGDQAGHILGVWNLMLIVCGLMYALVIGFVGWAVWRHRRRIGTWAPEVPEPDVQDPGLRKATAVWTVVIVAGISVLTAASFLVDRSLARATPDPLKIKVTAKQWWWDIEYQDEANPAQTLRTANELHLPQGRSAVVELQSQDVIHSFWVPNLHGKEDLIPGRTNEIILTPRRPGVFRGQCAEFCGTQHAHMALDVTVESPAVFAAWKQRQLGSGATPTTPTQAAGERVFFSKACVMCHQIGGTSAGSRAGPDLTHVASRRTLAAGTLPYSRSSLAAWISDPQGIKPGTNMPVVELSSGELNALVDYLDSLK
jgi:cytochrome c oxidase subunit 2